MELLMGIQHSRLREKNKERAHEKAYSPESPECINIYQEVFNNIKMPIIVTDKNLTIIMVNPHFERFSGFSQIELLGKSIWTFGISEESRKKIEENYSYRNTEPQKSPAKYEITIRDKEGKLRNWVLHNSILPGSEDIVVALQDITQQRDAESRFTASENYYQTIFENTGAATLLLEEDMTISQVNKECEKVLGYKKEKLIGKKWTKIVPESFAEKMKTYHNMRRKDPLSVPLKYKTKLIDKEGKLRNGQMAVDLIPGTKTSVATFIDLTEQSRTVQEMENYLKKMQRVLLQAANSLGTALEIRDPYTAGHQRKVAELSAAIAKEMGLPGHQCEGIAAAASLHDIGKITVPSEILSRPGELSELEMAIVRTHCQTGYEIIKDIEFAWPVAEIILQHHERMDGTGYPNGMAGKEILLEARIIAVADVVEAMSSHRPYRPTLGIKKALEEIFNNKGVLYDPDVVDACLRLFKEKNFKFK